MAKTDPLHTLIQGATWMVVQGLRKIAKRRLLLIRSLGIKYVSLVRLWRSRPRSGERARPAELKRRATQSFPG